ncbi:MAG: hypothetical protein ACRDNW_03835 [Trebonia sp.]
MRIETDEEPATQFRLKPAGAFLLRDYSNDDPADLKALRGLLEDILTQHKMLIPGSMNRLMVQWHADLHRAIEASGDKDEEGKRQTEKAAS